MSIFIFQTGRIVNQQRVNDSYYNMSHLEGKKIKIELSIMTIRHIISIDDFDFK